MTQYGFETINRWAFRLCFGAVGFFWLMAGSLPGTAHAEYRAYELEVVDLYECRLNKRNPCRTTRINTAMSAYLYVKTHGGLDRMGALMIATWVCRGDTSRFLAVCPRPNPIKARFIQNDDVQIALEKHITNGWKGKVEVVYYQASVRSNVYGVRFPDRRNTYARYYEKDLRKPGAQSSAVQPARQPTLQPPAQPAVQEEQTAQGVPAAQGVEVTPEEAQQQPAPVQPGVVLPPGQAGAEQAAAQPGTQTTGQPAAQPAAGQPAGQPQQQPPAAQPAAPTGQP